MSKDPIEEKKCKPCNECGEGTHKTCGLCGDPLCSDCAILPGNTGVHVYLMIGIRYCPTCADEEAGDDWYDLHPKKTLLANSWDQHCLSLLRWKERNGPYEARLRAQE